MCTFDENLCSIMVLARFSSEERDSLPLRNCCREQTPGHGKGASNTDFFHSNKSLAEDLTDGKKAEHSSYRQSASQR